MTQPSEPNDFTPPAQSTNSSNSSKIWIFVAAGLGCGCFGLIMIGIIAAIALPSFLNQAGKAKASEAKVYVGSMNRAQQAYRAENPTFASAIKDLGVGIKPETVNYSYQIQPQSDKSKSVMMTAKAKNSSLNSYTGAVFALKKGNDVITIAGVCETDNPSTTPPGMPPTPTYESGDIECPPGSRLVNSVQDSKK